MLETADILEPDAQFAAVLIRLTISSLYCFVIIPFALKLPKENDSYREYLTDIKLSDFHSFGRTLLVTFSCYLTLVVFQLTGSFVYYSYHPGNYVFDLRRNYLLYNVHSALFEEIVYRGVVLTMLFTRFSRRKSILISALVFGVVHFLNLLNPGSDVIWILATVVWATGYGILFGCLFLKTNSLLPSILLHWLINALGPVFLRGVDGYDPTWTLHKLIFSVVPSLLAVLWIHLLYQRWPVDTGVGNANGLD